MIVDTVTIKGNPVNIHTYLIHRAGKDYTYFRARLNKGDGTFIAVQGKTLEEIRNKIYYQYNVHAFVPSFHNLDITIGEALPQWINQRYGGGRQSTYVRNESAIRLHVIPNIANIKVQALTSGDVQSLMDRLSQKMSASNVHTICSLLRLFLQEYVDRHEIPYNPCDHVRLPVISYTEIVPLTKEEVARLLKGLDETGFRDLFALALLTAMRIGEIRGLTWDCIDFAHRTIEIKQEIITGTCILVPYVKNNNPQKVAFPQEVFDVLLESKRIQDRQKKVYGDAFSNPDNLVFTRDDGRPIPYKKIRNEFKKVVTNMDRADTRIHDLRHTMLSYIWDNTHDIEMVMLISRHKDPLSARTYIHPMQKTREEAAMLISNVAKELNVTAN